MKTLKIMLLVAMCTQHCFAQQIEPLKIDFFDFINPSSGITPRDCPLDGTQTIPYFLGGFDVYSTNKNGVGAFFLIPKREFGLWKIEDRSEWKREDLVKNNQEKIQNAKEFLSFSRDTLLAYFDLYIFHIKQEDMMIEGSYMSDDGELLDDYMSKDDATIYTYKHENGVWIEVNNENVVDESTRTYGIEVVEKILQERFTKFDDHGNKN